MAVKSWRDFWSAILFIAIGLAFALGARQYSFGTSVRPGPAYFPFGLGLLLVALGAIVLFRSLTLKTADGDPIGAIPWKPPVLVIASVALTGLTLPSLGLLLAIPLLVVLSAAAGDEFDWREVLIAATALTAGCWAVFIKGLGLPIPLLPSVLG